MRFKIKYNTRVFIDMNEILLYFSQRYFYGIKFLREIYIPTSYLGDNKHFFTTSCIRNWLGIPRYA